MLCFIFLWKTVNSSSHMHCLLTHKGLSCHAVFLLPVESCRIKLAHALIAKPSNTQLLQTTCGKLLRQRRPSNLPHRGGLSNLPHRGVLQVHGGDQSPLPSWRTASLAQVPQCACAPCVVRKENLLTCAKKNMLLVKTPCVHAL